ncbi:hypothetical protein PR048_016049 [Dryococelus australis]|uniref:Uncharacterized protein n=1 Tax=Dryococelus australis TaxID=614101 RepID=A0ABQ9HIN5_9NEOP|nr:hypothetical protein PR048_016049 [Dryococelus australis]
MMWSEVRRMPLQYRQAKEALATLVEHLLEGTVASARYLYIRASKTSAVIPSVVNRTPTIRWRRPWKILTDRNLSSDLRAAAFGFYNNIVATQQRKYSIHLTADPTCPLCGNTDTALHRLEAHEQQNKILLKNNAKAYESKLLNLQAQIGTISKENETLLEHLKSSASLVSELDGSVLEWSQRAEELREEVCLLRESNNKQEVLVSDCERDKQDYAEQLDECSSQVLHLAAELQSIKTERGELRKQLRTVEKHTRTAEQLEADLRCLQSDLTLASKTAQNQEKMIHLLTAEKAVVAENLVNMTSKIDRLELEVMSLRQTVNEQVNELDKAKDAINKAVKLENEVNNVGKELDAAKTTLAEQESVLARSEEEIKSFKSQVIFPGGRQFDSRKSRDDVGKWWPSHPSRIAHCVVCPRAQNSGLCRDDDPRVERATHAQHVSGATQRVLTCPTSPRPLEETAEQLYAVTSHASEQLSMHTA